MQLNVDNLHGGDGGTVEVNDAVFGVGFREPLVHQVVTAYLAAARSGTSAQKNRSAVAGGAAKPRRQKGSGRARVGTIRSPLFRGGGRAFPSSTRSYAQKVNRKMYRGAIRSILSELVRRERIRVVEAVELEAPKTKLLDKLLHDAGLDDVLFVVDGENLNLELASRNLSGVDIVDAREMNPVALLRRERLVVTAPALKRIEEQFS